ncbi:MAG TPA: prepilin-type N-terminal cleavage/methylation domain-containing protein [Byssovorax sp.]
MLNPLERLRVAKRRRGFTLIELLAVAAIISILAALASPAFVRIIRDQRVNRAALEIADLTRTARMRALGRGTAVVMRWTASGTTGLVEVREAVATGTDLLPAPSCANADFKDSGLTSRAVASLNFGNGAYELADIEFFDIGGTQQTTPEICFSPRGQTYFRTDGASAFQPLAGVPYFTLTNTNTGFVRTVFLPPNGAARVAL